MLVVGLCFFTPVGLQANTSADFEAFSNALKDHPQRALELFEAALAEPDRPGSADVLRSAILADAATGRKRAADAAPRLPLEARLAVHGAFADLRDPRLESDLVALFETADNSLRSLVLPIFEGAGTANSLPVLLDAMDQGNASFSNSVASVIVRMDLAGLDDHLLATLSQGTTQERMRAIRLAGIRNPQGTESRLLDLIEDSGSGALMAPALAALERVGTARTGRLFLERIGSAENAAAARPFQAAFRRLVPRLSGEVPMLWTEAFLPAWNQAKSDEIQTALILMIAGLRGKASGDFLLELIRNDPEFRTRALAQLRSWNHWDAAPYVVSATEVEDLSEQHQADVFRIGAALLSRTVRARLSEKQEFSCRLLHSAPSPELHDVIAEAMRDAKFQSN